MSFPGGSVIKNPPAKAGDAGSIPGFGRSPWRRKWQPTPIFLPGKSQGQRSLAGYSPWGHKELETIEYSCIIFQILFPYKPLQSIEKSLLYYIVGTYQLSILYIVVCICQLEFPSLSLPLYSLVIISQLSTYATLLILFLSLVLKIFFSPCSPLKNIESRSLCFTGCQCQL